VVRPAHSVRAAVTAREAVASVASVLRRAAFLVACAVAAPVLVACGGSDGDATLSRPATADTSTSAPAEEPTTTLPTSTSTTAPPVTTPRPDWLGTRVLPEGPDGFGAVLPTPPELADRRFATIDLLPPPETDEFTVSVGAVPGDVVTRSTWSDACPVPLGDLRYVTMPFWGFDQELHTGELLIHADAVEAVTAGFRQLFERRFPIEEMRITRADELDAPPTGDGNNTSAFVCRPTRGSTKWSEHALGRAVDINPFHNPYVKGDLVLPELASVYADRSQTRPGMLTAQDAAGFQAAGWGWGSTWSSFQDHMHLSAGGR
jgi:hypothetical protein